MKEITFDIKPNGCHECTSHSLDGHGYPRIKRDGKEYKIYRWLYEQEFGELPEGIVVRHLCNNPKCIRLSHLASGTQKDNSADMIKAGTSFHGENNPRSKLAQWQVDKIKTATGFSDRALAEAFGVSKKTINHIRNGYSWAGTSKLPRSDIPKKPVGRPVKHTPRKRLSDTCDCGADKYTRETGLTINHAIGCASTKRERK